MSNTATQPSIGTQTSSTALEKTHIIATRLATLVSVIATNTGAADAWLQIHNKATAVAADDVPIQQVLVPAGGTVGVDVPIKCTAGIVVALSTTPEKYTALATSVGWFTTRHI